MFAENRVRWFGYAVFAFLLLAGGGRASASTDVTIISPISGTTVRGTVSIAASITSAVTWINVYIDGKYWMSSPPYNFSWNSTTVGNGNHTISANAYSSSNVLIGRSAVTVYVQNGTQPTATPSIVPTPTATAVTITSPANGSTVRGTTSIAASVAAAVAWLNVYIDGRYLASSPPYVIAWNTDTDSNGNHTISAKAYQSNGTLLGQCSASVNVQNGTSPTATPKPTATPTPVPNGMPRESHVFLLLEENHSFSEITSSSMPYLTSLESKGTIATDYFANAHPSLPNYMWLTTGGDGGFTSDVCPTTTNVDNIVRDLTAGGLSWKAYEESIPSIGYLGCDSGSYLAHHDPFAYFSDVRDSPSQASHIVPFSQLATDIKNGALPSFGFITPNFYDDAHTGTLAAADSWLKTNIAPLLNSASFQSGGHGLLIIVFDEGTDDANGGGQVFWLAIGPDVKRGSKAATFYQHENTLKLIADALGFPAPGSAVNADDMAEIF